MLFFMCLNRPPVLTFSRFLLTITNIMNGKNTSLEELLCSSSSMDESHWKFVLSNEKLKKKLSNVEVSLNMLSLIPQVLYERVPRIFRSVEMERTPNVEDVFLFYFCKFITSFQSYTLLGVKNLWYLYERRVREHGLDVYNLPSRLVGYIRMFDNLLNELPPSKAYFRVLGYVKDYISSISPTYVHPDLKPFYDNSYLEFVIMNEVVTKFMNEYVEKSGLVHRLVEFVANGNFDRVLQNLR